MIYRVYIFLEARLLQKYIETQLSALACLALPRRAVAAGEGGRRTAGLESRGHVAAMLRSERCGPGYT